MDEKMKEEIQATEKVLKDVLNKDLDHYMGYKLPKQFQNNRYDFKPTMEAYQVFEESKNSRNNTKYGSGEFVEN